MLWSTLRHALTHLCAFFVLFIRILRSHTLFLLLEYYAIRIARAKKRNFRSLSKELASFSEIWPVD